MLAAELSDIELAAALAHFGGARIADMAVVRPGDCFRILALRVEQQFERVEHMRVAQVPAFRRAIEHRAIIGLGIRNKASVLSSIEKVVAVVRGMVASGLEQVAKLGDDRFLAAGIAFADCHPAIACGIAAKRREAAIAFARDRCRFGILTIEIGQNRLDRCGHVVKVKAVKARTMLHGTIGVIGA